MPAVGAHSASRMARPVVDKGRAGADDLGMVGGRVIGRIRLLTQRRVKTEKWSGTSRTSRVPAEDKLESTGEVGVEMLEDNVGNCRWP